MFKRVKRKPEKSQCWRCFANRVRYIINQSHPHHKIKKVVLAAINLACLWGQTAKDFNKAVHEAQNLWKVRRKKAKRGGNPTQDIFFELIYSAPKWVRTTREERYAIDKIITAPFNNCPIRRGWHLAAWDLEQNERPENWKPLDDAHYLISARDNFGNATISTRFGDGKETLESWMRRMDAEICDILNRSREVQYEPVHVIHRRRLGEKLEIKLTKLSEMIAYHTLESVMRENLVAVIENLQERSKKTGKMEQAAKVTNTDRSLQDDKLVWILFSGREQRRKYRIKKLLLDIAETQLDIELARPDGHEGVPAGPLTPVSASAESMKPSVALPLSVESQSAQSTPIPTSAQPEPILAAPGPVPEIPGVMPPSSAASDPDDVESAKPQAAPAPSAPPVPPVHQPGPVNPKVPRKKSRWRPKPQPENPNTDIS